MSEIDGAESINLLNSFAQPFDLCHPRRFALQANSDRRPCRRLGCGRQDGHGDMVSFLLNLPAVEGGN